LNRQFSQEAAEPGSAFVGAHNADLDRIFAIRHDGRVVANDNSLRVNNLTLQLEKSRFRDHFAKCRVDVFEHLDGTYTVVWKKRTLGRYDENGRLLLPGGQPPDPRGLSPGGPGKRSKMGKGKRSASPSSPDIPPRSGRSPALPYPPARLLQDKGSHCKTQPDISGAMKTGHLYVLLTESLGPALTVFGRKPYNRLPGSLLQKSF